MSYDKERRLARLRERYATDPGYKARVLEQQREYRKDPDYNAKARARKERWTAEHKEHLRKKRREWYANEMAKPENRRAASLRARRHKLRLMGVTPEILAAHNKAQKGLCMICGRDNGSRPLLVDHDHTTGRFRALLCSPCNTGLGLFRDSPDLLEAAIRYLTDMKEAVA